MPTNPYLRHRYSDLVDGGDDADVDEVARDLEALAASTPRPHSLPASFEAVLEQREALVVRTPRRFRPFLDAVHGVPRVVVVPVVALLILALAGAAYAAHSVLEQAFTINGGTQQILAGNLGREINQSRTVDGFTVTVERAYADPGAIVVGFTLTGPPNRQFNSMTLFGTYDFAHGQRLNTLPILTDDQGRRFAGGPAPFAPGVQGRTTAALLEYSPEGITAGQILNLHLHASAINVIEALPTPAGAGVHEPPCEERPADNLCVFTVRGAFDFDFSVPVDSGESVSVNQTDVSGGTAVTLERVVLGATRASIILRGAGPSAHVTASVNGTVYPFERPAGLAVPGIWSPQSGDSYVIEGDLRDERGTWTVQVSPGDPLPPRVAPHAATLKGGPWVFHVVVP